MIIYKDILTGDEIISDSYDLKDAPCAGLWEVDCTRITIGGETFDTGANASLEEQEEGVEDTAKTEIDIVYSFRLQSMPKPSKKAAGGILKKFAKAVLTKLKEDGKADQAASFQKTAPDAVKHLLSNWDDYDMYVGESDQDIDAGSMMVLINYRDDGVTPFATFWRYALQEMKV